MTLSHKADILSQASIYDSSSMSLSPEVPLEVLRVYIVSAGVTNYVGKIAIVCGIFLVCYDWRKCCCCPLKRSLILCPSNISRQRGTTTPHLKFWYSDNYAHLLASYYLGMACQVC